MRQQKKKSTTTTTTTKCTNHHEMQCTLSGKSFNTGNLDVAVGCLTYTCYLYIYIYIYTYRLFSIYCVHVMHSSCVYKILYVYTSFNNHTYHHISSNICFLVHACKTHTKKNQFEKTYDCDGCVRYRCCCRGSSDGGC